MARRLRLVLAILGLSGLAASAREPGSAGLPANLFPAPDRPVAEIVAPIWSTERERDAVDEIGQVTRVMGIRAGMSVADLGAGSGYYTVRLSPIVGSEGRVLAEDVTPRYLRDLQRRVRRLKLGNVTVIRGEPHDPRLPPGSVDVALLVHMYHEIAQPFAFLFNLAPAMRPGSRVGIIDYEGPTWEHGTPPDLLRCELAAVGYREISSQKLTGDLGYLAVFAPPEPAARPQPHEIRPCRLQKPPPGR